MLFRAAHGVAMPLASLPTCPWQACQPAIDNQAIGGQRCFAGRIGASTRPAAIPMPPSRLTQASDRYLPGSLTIARFALIEALRGKLALAVLAVALLGFGIAVFLGEMAITEAAKIQGSALAAFNRAAAAVLVVSFVIAGLTREQADKGLEMLLSQAIPRTSYVLGKLAGYTVLAWMTAVLFGLPLLVFAPGTNVAAWAMSLALELTLVAAAALACALVLGQSALSLLMVAAFYTLSRVMTTILAITSNPLGPVDSVSFHVMGWVMRGIAALLPSLDRFASAAWLWEGGAVWAQLPAVVIQFAIYLPLLTGIALFDFYRKNL